MKIFNKRLTWTSAGCALALISGTPAIADDTELLLVNPNPASQPKPNVMFILDTSGSMTDPQTTTKPYDHTRTYTGTCQTDAMYWTDIDLIPSCDVSNEQWVRKSAYECDFATRQIQGIGSFTNTMVQLIGVDDGDTEDGTYNVEDATWTYPEPGNHNAPVECQADSSLHGDGTTGVVYALAGTDLDAGWTSDSAQEVSWGSAPLNLSYTFYDGNYLNYKQTPETESQQRTQIMKTVTTTVLNSVNNMNVGIMRFNDKQGGTIVQDITDLDTNRTAIINKINALPADGYTPLSETLYESALYWMGDNVDFGDVAITDTSAFAATATAGVNGYTQPTLGSCAKNYNVLISDGKPTEDDDGLTKGPSLKDFNTLLGRSNCVDSGQGACLNDVAEYLSKVDIDPNTTGTQAVTTHTIGFTQDLPILKDAAVASGGDYFRADDIEQLTVALLRIVGEINDRTLSFSAPAVSVNTFNRTRNLNDVYLTVFGARNKTRWPGNLKKYGIKDGDIVDADGIDAVDPLTGFFYDTSRSIWTVGGDDGQDVELGGAARQLPNPSARNLYTNNGSDNSLYDASNALSGANAGAYTAADFGLTGATGEPTVAQMIDWMRGADVRDEDGNPATTVRYAMGDPLHSRPAAIVYGGTEANPDVVIYTATNDGYIHAINGATGAELWSFVPKELLPNMARLYFDPSAKFKQYGVDGDIISVVKDVDGDGTIETNDGDFVRIVVGMRRGGSNYYAIDVSRKNSPELLWVKTVDDGGQSWSAPVVARVNVDTTNESFSQNADKAVVILGGGYDPVHDVSAHPSTNDGAGAGIHMLDLESGETLWWGAINKDDGATKAFPDMKRAFATQVRVIDFNSDNFADRMYASDMGGQVWRFDIKNGEAPGTLVNGGVIAQLGAEGVSGTPTAGQTRRFYNSPDVSIFRDPIQGRRYVSVAIGSGYRARPFDVTATDMFFALRDPAVFNQLTQTEYDNYDKIKVTDLVEVSGDVKASIPVSADGWKFTLPADEKVLAGSITFNNEIFFVSFDPRNVGAQTCGTGQGTNFLYRVSVVNGDPIVNNLDAVTPTMADSARRTQLAQGGIAATPTVVFPSPDNPSTCTGPACSPPPIICVGVECRDDLPRLPPVRTLWTQDGIQ